MNSSRENRDQMPIKKEVEAFVVSFFIGLIFYAYLPIVVCKSLLVFSLSLMFVLTLFFIYLLFYDYNKACKLFEDYGPALSVCTAFFLDSVLYDFFVN
jgi:hypothetical protein